MKLLHFADLHLDAPFAWASPEAARLRRRNRRLSLTRILELASQEGCDAILAGGDLFELDRVRPATLAGVGEAAARAVRGRRGRGVGTEPRVPGPPPRPTRRRTSYISRESGPARVRRDGGPGGRPRHPAARWIGGP